MTSDAPAVRTALAAAREAGEILLHRFGSGLGVQTKSNAIDLVTVADREAEAAILARLQADTPDFAVLAEESGVRSGRQGAPRWVVDPLDGTTNYAHGFPHFCVSIGLLAEGEVALGVVHDPIRAETFVAERGQGAWLRRAGHEDRRLGVSGADALAQALLATGFGYDRATASRNNVAEFSTMITRVRGIRRPGSAALDLAWTAAGRVDGYWEFHLAPWDWCAGVALVREAGGVIATVDGEPWSLDGESIVAGGATTVAAIRGALRP